MSRFEWPPSSMMTSKRPPEVCIHFASVAGSRWLPTSGWMPMACRLARCLSMHGPFTSASHSSASGSNERHSNADAPGP
eukprot:scaffold1000_cov68-Phaeocystis_antarctica.AAC.2